MVICRCALKVMIHLGRVERRRCCFWLRCSSGFHSWHSCCLIPTTGNTSGILPCMADRVPRELMCGLHQLVFGVLISSYLRFNAQQVPMNSSEASWTPDLFMSCTVPIVMESLLFRVRLKYHYMLSAGMVALVAYPLIESGSLATSLSDYVVDFAATLLMPACVITLYQSHMRRKFEGML